ncbi:MAG: type II glyceraldehyde-3-phosphate dehydrogenase [Candidatus Undinarchaeales archaeon]
MIKVGVNGYGTIGKRVADAVSKQDDMEVVGVTKTRPTWEADMAIKSGYDLYCAIPERAEKFKEAGVKISGTIEDLLEKSDIIVDCSPKPYGSKNKEKYYIPNKVKAIFQGGESSEVAEMSFNAQSNYKEALGKNYVRVVSCNTTGLSRVLNSLDEKFGVKKARVVLIRRSADPGNSKKGPINAIVPNPVKSPSHHGPDVKTVLPDMDIVTSAVKIPTTIMHLHTLMIELEKEPSEKEVADLFEKNSRIKMVDSKKGFRSTAEVIEYARDLGRKRNDLYENMVWEDSISMDGNELYFFQAIHQESDAIPENIDAIRAMFELESDGNKSIKKTNKSLGI